MPSTTITFEHGRGNEPSALDDGELCQDEIEVELTYEPTDTSVGIMPGDYGRDNDPPAKCEECGHFYTIEEQLQIVAQMDKAAQEYEPDEDLPDSY